MLRQNDTVLGKQSADLIPDLGTRSDQPASDPMKSLQILLFDRLSRNESHLRPAHCFTDRVGVISIVLLGQQIRPYKLWRNQAHGMPKCFQNTSPVMSSLGCFQPDHALRQVRKKSVSCALRNRFLNVSFPSRSNPCNWNTFFAVSRPTTLVIGIDLPCPPPNQKPLQGPSPYHQVSRPSGSSA